MSTTVAKNAYDSSHVVVKIPWVLSTKLPSSATVLSRAEEHHNTESHEQER